LTPASFDDPGGTSGANTAEFAADVKNSSNGNTGLIGAAFTSSGGTVPEPMSIALFGGVLILTARAIRRRFV
jgi:hypothetical protein